MLLLVVGSLSYMDIRLEVIESALWVDCCDPDVGRWSVLIFSPCNLFESDPIALPELVLDSGVTDDAVGGGTGRFFKVRAELADALLVGVALDGTDLEGGCRSFSSLISVIGLLLETNCGGNDNFGGLELVLLDSGGRNIEAIFAFTSHLSFPWVHTNNINIS